MVESVCSGLKMDFKTKPNPHKCLSVRCFANTERCGNDEKVFLLNFTSLLWPRTVDGACLKSPGVYNVVQEADL